MQAFALKGYQMSLRQSRQGTHMEMLDLCRQFIDRRYELFFVEGFFAALLYKLGKQL